MSPRRYAVSLAAILAAGVLARVAVILWVPTRPVSDFYGFFRVAQNLAAAGRFEAKPGLADNGRSPAYPILLSLAFRAAPNDELAAAKAVNVALFAVAALAASALARRFGGDAAGVWTAGLVAFLPRPVLMADLVASENLAAPLLFLFLGACVASWHRPSLSVAAAVGALAGLLCLTRAILWAIPLVWLAGAIAVKLRWRSLAAQLLLILAVEHAVLLPWAMRNAQAVGRFTPFHSVGGVGLFIANNAHATGEWYRWGDDLERLRPGVIARGAVAIDDAAREEALRWIRGNPGAAARGYLRRLKTILADDAFVATFAILAEAMPAPAEPKPVLAGPHPLKSHPGAVRLVLRAASVLLAAAAIGGFFLLLRGARRGEALERALLAGFLVAGLYLPLAAAAASAANGRSRWMTEDAIAPVAAMFLAHARRRA
ncbi:MAG TPA: hypothetical protein VH854_02935 [Thermoanaerobaculia bacterium]|nr:hypothetical protein [Thermoanaerobaculia bacterium]